MASALGEEVEETESNENETEAFEEETQENTEKTEEPQNEVEQNTQQAPVIEEKTIQEKTLGTVLNINWEELKKAKAKVTITIDFGG